MKMLFIRKIKNAIRRRLLFVKNVWRFRKELANYDWWDFHFTLNMLERSIFFMEKGIREKGIEIEQTRIKKVKSMQRALEILHNHREDNYVEIAEKEFGPLTVRSFDFEKMDDDLTQLVDIRTPEQYENDHKIIERSHELENNEWNELWEIFKGTKYSKRYDKNYDGTDMRSWWD
jgi:hypothetical protein